MKINKIKSHKGLSIALVLCMILALLPAGIGLSQLAKAESQVLDISGGPINIPYLPGAQYGDYTIIQTGGETPNEITIPRNYDGTLTLSGVMIVAANPIKYDGNGAFTANYTIELDGINVLTSTGSPAVPVLRDTTVTFKAKTHTELDSLDATGGTAIGAPANTAAGAIIVESGTITATATTNSNAAAIGVGPWYSNPGGNLDSFSLTINGGKVTAVPSNRAAIGAGAQGYMGKITVNGGELTAIAGWGSSAIGGQYGDGTRFKGPEVVITGGNVTLAGGEGQPAIGFSGAPPAGTKLATGSVTIMGGNVNLSGKNAPAIGGVTPYVDESTDYFCMESIVILPEANVSGTIHGFAASVTGGTPIIGRAKNIFYLNESNLASIGSNTPYNPTAALTLDTTTANINVFADFSGYSTALESIIKAAYAKKTGAVPASSEFNMGITGASGSLPLYYYNSFVAAGGAEVEFTAAGWKPTPATGTALVGLEAAAAVTYTSSGSMATATPTPSPVPTLPPSTDTRLKSLSYLTSFGEVVTVPGFTTAQTEGEYTVTVPHGKTAVRLMASPAHGKATAAVDSGGAVALNPDGTTVANVTVTAQSGLQKVFKVNFVQGAYLPPAEDRIWFADEGNAAISSADAGKWNGTSGSVATVDPGNGNAANRIATYTAGTAVSIGKGFLEFEEEAVISARLYIPSAAGKKPASAQLKLDGKTLISLNENGQYTIGAVTKPFSHDEWITLDFHIKPAETGTGSTYVERKASSWANSSVTAWVNGELAESIPISINYTQQVLGNNSNMPTSGWGSGGLPSFNIDVNPSAGSHAEILFDDIRIYEPHNFILTDMQVEQHSDQARNIKLNGSATLIFNHDIDLSTFDPATTLTVLEEGVPFTPASITVDPTKPNRIIVSFAGTPMKTQTFYEFVLKSDFADVTGRMFDIYGDRDDGVSLQFTTGGEEGSWPPPIATIAPETGEAFIMPDAYNTGYKSKFEDLQRITSKYPGLRVSGGFVYIDKNAVAMYGNVFSGFILDPGKLIITAGNVIVEDFYINLHREDHGGPLSVTGGAKNVLVQDGELVNGGGTIVDGENVKLLRVHMHGSYGDALKPATNWWVESCYIHNLGNAPHAHADGAQISGDAKKLVSDIRLYGNRFDTPAIPYFNVSNTPLWLALNFGDATNIDIEYNWYNGGGYGSAIGGYPFKLTNVTYDNNQMGIGRLYGNLRYDAEREAENAASQNVNEPIFLEALDIPSAGSVVYYDSNGKPVKGASEDDDSYARRKRIENRIYDLADAGDKITVMVNFANYTARAQNVKVTAKIFGKDGNLKETIAPSALAPLPRYITANEYYDQPVSAYLEVMRQYLIDEHGIEVSFAGLGHNHQRASALAVHNHVLKPWVEDVLNHDPAYNVRGEWYLVEAAKHDEDRAWFLGLKKAPDLPQNVEREITFNLPNNLANGDYMEVSVYKDWGGAKADELLRPVDTLYFGGETVTERKFTVSNLDLKKVGDEYIAGADVSNTFTTSQSVNFTVAVYDGSKLMDIVVLPQGIPANYTGPIDFKYVPAIALLPQYTVKVMAWKATMEPFCVPGVL